MKIQEQKIEIDKNAIFFAKKSDNLKSILEKDLKDALYGFRSSKEKFVKMVLDITINKEKLVSLDNLKERYKIIYATEQVKENLLSYINYTKIGEIENDDIFKEEILGNENNIMSALIKELNNSVWVEEGMKYTNKSNEKCPFCQQSLNNVIDQLNNFFDMTYKSKCKYLKDFSNQYYIEMKNNIESIKMLKSKKLKNSYKIEETIEKLETLYQRNLDMLHEKNNNPKITIELENSTELFDIINKYIKEENEIINDNNKNLDNIKLAQKKLKDDVWNYIANELEEDIKIYKTERRRVLFDFNLLEEEKESIVKKIAKVSDTILQKEITLTTIKKALIDINNVLSKFGYNAFKLEEGSLEGTYKIVRENGEDVRQTLSEGELRLISFIYYYNLAKGSFQKNEVSNNKILLIDDPTSGLDEKGLNIVSDLIKELISGCLEDANTIKQILILTHNKTFYETFIKSKNEKIIGGYNQRQNQETSFIINKINEISRIEKT